MMNFRKGEVVEWDVTATGDLMLRRISPGRKVKHG